MTAFTGMADRLVTISSGDVYRAHGRLTGHEPGPIEPVPLAEDALLRTVLYPYRGWEKALGAYAHDYEKILAEKVVSECSELPWTILRLPKVYGPEDNADLATVYGFAHQPDWRWTHGHVDNIATAIVLAATHPAGVGRIYNVGETHTPTMGERLADLPPSAAPPKPVPAFNYAQSIVFGTARIRSELGYREVVDERDAMLSLAQDLAKR
jgi:nucleoside-diphosphate-sugar epimerase